MPRLSVLPNAGALTGQEIVPVDQGGTTVQTTAQAIADLGSGSTSGLPAGGNVGDVLTKTGATTAAWQQPTIPFASTNW